MSTPSSNSSRPTPTRFVADTSSTTSASSGWLGFVSRVWRRLTGTPDHYYVSRDGDTKVITNVALRTGISYGLRPATRTERARRYLTKPRFSWVEFLLIVIVISIIRAYVG